MNRIDDDIVRRMMALCRGLAKVHFCNAHDEQAEARAIVSLLPEPTDPDEEEAKNLVMGSNYYLRKSPIDLCIAAIKRGRELARQEGVR